MSAPGPDNPMHDDDNHFAPPSSAQGSSLKRVIKSRSPALLTTAAPARRTFFDSWNSSSTGHQRAENRLSGSTSWHASRNLKLCEQYKGCLAGGGNRVQDTVGAGSEDFGKDGRKENGGWERCAKGLKTGGQKSSAEFWSVSKASKTSVLEKAASQEEMQRSSMDAQEEPCESTSVSESQKKQIFQGLCFYVNGSTSPMVSDHRLKRMLAAHGARHSITLGRRTVTHVILGTVSTDGGCGGGLAATKLQKEVARISGKSVKYITVNWVLESIQAGRRLPESRFAPLKLAQKSQGDVFGMLNRSKAVAHG